MNTNNKTILLVRNAAKNDFGGAETYQVSLAKILNKNGYDPIVVTRSQRLLDYAQQNRVKTIRGWWWPKQDWGGKYIIMFPLFIVWELALTTWYARLLTKTKAIAIHAQSRDDFIACTFAARIKNKKVIWTDHMDLRYIFTNIAKPLKNLIGKTVYLATYFADDIIIISDNERKLIARHLKNPRSLDKKIRLIKNGVIDSNARYAQEPIKNSLFCFCLASRIVTNKGIGETIAAFKIVQEKLGKDNLCLAIYGDGPEIKKFKNMSKHHKNIRFFGHHHNALQKISQADVFILPSYQEGFSIALLEAMMLGKPIIATDVDSNPELIINNKTGLLVKPKDPTALAGAMLKLYSDPQLRKNIASSARISYVENYNLDDIAKNKIIPLYEN